jgi:hypothetical protein
MATINTNRRLTPNKEVVRGQYGSDSNEAQAIGLKKKSDRKRPTRQKAIAS